MTRREALLEALDRDEVKLLLNKRCEKAFWFAFLGNAQWLEFTKIVYLCGFLDALTVWDREEKKEPSDAD